MLIILKAIWKIVCFGPMVYDVNFWDHTAMPVVATISAITILLWVESHLTQLLFNAAWERMTAEYPPATNTNLGREQGTSKSIRMMQNGSCLVEAMEAVENKVRGRAASLAWHSR